MMLSKFTKGATVLTNTQKAGLVACNLVSSYSSASYSDKPKFGVDSQFTDKFLPDGTNKFGESVNYYKSEEFKLRERDLVKKQPLLFTPGPLNTSITVKRSMLFDAGSRDTEFMRQIQEIKDMLLYITDVDPEEYSCILLQGSGTYAIEAALTTTIPKEDHHLLIIENGAYGQRQCKIAEYNNIRYSHLSFPEDAAVRMPEIRKFLKKNPDVTHVSIIHSETTSGVLNPVDKIAREVKKINPEIVFLSDSISAFGVYPIDMDDEAVDVVCGSSNKNLQGVPGFAFTIMKKDLLAKCKGNARSLVLDLQDQEAAYEKSGQFRFTPPTHAIRAFHRAVIEYNKEGGLQGRFRRYRRNQRLLSKGLKEMGLSTYIQRPRDQGCIITTILPPEDKPFDFPTLYDSLAAEGIVIYPGKLTTIPTFRLGSIGTLTTKEIKLILNRIKEHLDLQASNCVER